MENEIQRDLGPQPIDALLREFEADNHEVVDASPEQLTHKQVQRARKGRRLTANMQAKILEAVRAYLAEKGVARKVGLGDLFNYRS